MDRPYRHIDVERDGDVYCVSLRNHQPDDPSVRALGDEIEALVTDDGCRKLVIRLGPLECLYSVLIARLIKLRRSVAEHGGRLQLCEVSPQVMSVFQSCQLHDYFEFAPDLQSAIAALKR